ncbi:glucokinase [Sphingorhabdus sp. Alg231-15]|uniref:glucokinase n=1 Tax=Sphingorhabdus sp. Alg231-15 TaxID=1922222 RepID=UPI000D558BBB
MTQEIVTADIGGTHARFAIAQVEGHHVEALTDQVVMKSADHASLQTAWEFYADQIGRALPKDGAIAVAGPVGGELLRFTNNPWIVRPHAIPTKLGLDRFTLINDFGAVAHAVAHLNGDSLVHCCGPAKPLPAIGPISIFGPGTGLGAVQLLRTSDSYHVIETEGGHTDFAPLDSIEDQILQKLRQKYRRVSVERIVSGPGLVAIHEVLSNLEGRAAVPVDDRELWEMALEGKDSLAAAALDRFCLSLGAVAGDLALAQGAKAVVIGGGLGARIADILPQSGFCQRFVAKGRFEAVMQNIPVKLLRHPQPGLFGAAAAFLQEHNV